MLIWQRFGMLKVMEVLESARRQASMLFPGDDLNIIFTGDEETKCVIGGAIYAKESG